MLMDLKGKMTGINRTTLVSMMILLQATMLCQAFSPPVYNHHRVSTSGSSQSLTASRQFRASSPSAIHMSSDQNIYSPSLVKVSFNPISYIAHRLYVVNYTSQIYFQSPSDIYTGAVKLGASKASASAAKIFRLGLISGAHIGFGAYLAMSVGGAIPGIQQTNPGLAKLIYGAVFPLGLMMTSITGAELFTGNTALVSAAWVERQIKLKDLLKSWSVSYIANFIGSILFAALIMRARILSSSQLPLNIALAKVALPFDVAFTRAILCNWLVCMAVYMASGCLSMTGKMVTIWFPICAFVTVGLEHSVANMFFIPLGMMFGADITISQFLMKNLLPVTLGNIVGAVLCVMAPFGTSFGNWFRNHTPSSK